MNRGERGTGMAPGIFVDVCSPAQLAIEFTPRSHYPESEARVSASFH